MSELSSKRPIVHGRIISRAYNERDGGGGNDSVTRRSVPVSTFVCVQATA